MRSSGGRTLGIGICEVKARNPIQVTEALVESLPVERGGGGRRRRRTSEEGIDGGVTPIPGADGLPESMGMSEAGGFLAGHGKR